MSNDPGARQIGFTQGVKACIAWLHKEAAAMSDPHAQLVLNNAAFHLGTDKPTFYRKAVADPDEIEQGLADCGTGAPYGDGSAGNAAAMAAYNVLRCCHLIRAGDWRVPQRIGNVTEGMITARLGRPEPLPPPPREGGGG